MRYIAKWLSQLLLVSSALLAGEWSLFNFFNLVQSDGSVHIGRIQGPKAHVELAFRLAIVIFALILIAAVDIIDVYLPRRQLKKFRSDYLDLQCTSWRADLKVEGIRISTLYARRRWYMPLWRVFDWAWSDGFEPPLGHRDVNMPLACWQGISGQAYKSGVSKSAFFTAPQPPLSFKQTWLLANSYRFTAFQLRKTSIVTGIISIPMLRKSHGDSPSYKAIGVITVDAYTSVAAQFLKQNEDDLVEYFFRIGKLLASLDM